MPKLWSELDIQKSDDGTDDWKLTAGWLGAQFCTMSISALVEVTEQPPGRTLDTQDDGLLWYKYIPRSGTMNNTETRQADAEYTVFLSHVEEAKVERKVKKSWKGTGHISFDALDTKRLPTVHHIVERLAEIPVYEVVEAKVVQGEGVSDVSSARQLL